MKIELNHLIFI